MTPAALAALGRAQEGGLLAWIIRHPQAAAEALRLLAILAEMQCEVVAPPGAGASLRQPLRLSDTNALLPVPLRFPNSYAVPTGTPLRTALAAAASTTASAGYVQAEVQAINDRLKETRQILAALILDLQATQQAPVTP
jgi:hypothetical protein